MGFALILQMNPNKMKVFIIIFFFLFNFQTYSQKQNNPAKEFNHLSASEIDQYLPRLHKAHPSFDDRLRVIALRRLGTPYYLKAIGDGKGYDSNPVFNIRTTNCTAFILTNVALASARSYQQANSAMAHINYYPVPAGQNPINYRNRIHYTSHRLKSSNYFYLITDSIAVKSEQRTINLILNRQQDGSRFLPIGWEKQIELNYIPRKHITKDLLKRFPKVCGVGIVRKELFAKGIIIGHEGMVLDGKYFIHASLFAGKVVKEDFYRYTRKRRVTDGKFVCDGIVIYRMKEVRE